MILTNSKKVMGARINSRGTNALGWATTGSPSCARLRWGRAGFAFGDSRPKIGHPSEMADAGPEPDARPPIRAEIAGNRIELIESGAGRFKLLLELIGGATNSIKMLMYMFNP